MGSPDPTDPTDPTGQPYPAASYPSCPCYKCDSVTWPEIAPGFPLRIRMSLCPRCGNKRCPAAADHHNECSGSNEPGQPGSLYPAHYSGYLSEVGARPTPEPIEPIDPIDPYCPEHGSRPTAYDECSCLARARVTVDRNVDRNVDSGSAKNRASAARVGEPEVQTRVRTPLPADSELSELSELPEAGGEWGRALRKSSHLGGYLMGVAVGVVVSVVARVVVRLARLRRVRRVRAAR